MNQTKGNGSFRGVGLGATAAVAMVLCCAAPALLTGGLLASLGAVVGNPLVIALGVALVIGAVVLALFHRSRACCPPEGAQVATAGSADDAGLPWSSRETSPTGLPGTTPGQSPWTKPSPPAQRSTGFLEDANDAEQADGR